MGVDDMRVGWTGFEQAPADARASAPSSGQPYGSTAPSPSPYGYQPQPAAGLQGYQPSGEYAIPPADGYPKLYDLEAAYPSAPQPYPCLYYPPLTFVNPAEKNGMGTAALVLGIVSFFLGGLVTAIIAIVLGHQGRKAATQGRATNGGSATAGMVLGIIATVLFSALILVYIAAVVGLMLFWR